MHKSIRQSKPQYTTTHYQTLHKLTKRTQAKHAEFERIKTTKRQFRIYITENKATHAVLKSISTQYKSILPNDKPDTLLLVFYFANEKTKWYCHKQFSGC